MYTVAALSVSEQVLLMTCKVKVTAADLSSIIARALINPGSAASYRYTFNRCRVVPGVWR